MIRPFRSARLLALCTLLGLTAGCGFQPLYGTSSFSALPGMHIEAGDTRQDFLIEQELDRFLGAGTSDYRLDLQTNVNERPLGVSAAGRARRFSYDIDVRWRLSAEDGETLTGDVSETVYFDAPNDPFALLSARSDAEERAAEQIARRLVRELTGELVRLRDQDPS